MLQNAGGMPMSNEAMNNEVKNWYSVRRIDYTKATLTHVERAKGLREFPEVHSKAKIAVNRRR